MHPSYGVLRPVTPLASVLLARNPSPMTLEGTNTWVLRAPGVEECVVVDPGDADEQHLRRVAAQGPVAVVLLTHRHHDHAGGARRVAELSGAPVRALDPSLVLGPELPDAPAAATHYLTHREQRLEQVRAAVATLGPGATSRHVVELVYADVDRALWTAAEWSVRAQLDYLRI